MGVSFFGFVNEFGGAGALCFRSVAVFIADHESEYVVEEVVCRFW